MELPEKPWENTGMSRCEKRARRRGEGRVTRHADNNEEVLNLVGFDPFPEGGENVQVAS
jgi:hypothetical protein